MKLLKKTKSKVGKFFLNKEAAKVVRKRKVFNLKSATSIGILYDATSGGPDFEKVKKFALKLIGDKKDVSLLVFYDLKTSPNIISEKLRYDFITRKDLSRLMKPKDAQSELFMKREFDILINLNIKHSFPLIYISALSCARFKVGINKEKYKNYYDFLIGNTDNKIDTFIHDVEHYLSIINS